MEESVKAILFTFLFDMTIFILELCIFFCIRNRRGDEDKRKRGLFNYHPVNFTLKQVFNPCDLKPSIANEDKFITDKHSEAERPSQTAQQIDLYTEEESKSGTSSTKKEIRISGLQISEEKPKRASSEAWQEKGGFITQADGQQNEKQTNQEILASILKSDKSKSSGKKDKNLPQIYSSHGHFKGMNCQSQLLKIHEREEGELMLQLDDFGDKHQTHNGRAHSQVFSIDDVELEFDAQGPTEADNQIVQDGFKNPYFRKRANSLLLKHQILNQVLDDANISEDGETRKNICCFACTISNDMFNWFKVLWQLDDNKLQEINGTDYTLYLVFLRYSAFLCAIITMFNCILMVPLYASGQPSTIDDQEDSTEMNILTVLNITASPIKMKVSYCVALFVFPSFALVMILRYKQKYEGWKKKVNPMKPFRDIDIARYAVKVTNLPIDEGVESLQRKITASMLKIFPTDPNTNQSPFIKARVIGDYNYLYKKCVALKRNVDLLEQVKKKNSESDVRQEVKVRRGLKCWCCGIRKDSQKHYEGKIESLKIQIRRELQRQKGHNTGTGFLIFQDERIVKDFKHFGKNYFYSLIEQNLQTRSIERLQMRRWTFSHAFPQSDIIWEDFTKDSVISGTKTFILWVFLLLLSVVLITPVMIVSLGNQILDKYNIDIPWLTKDTINTYLSSFASMFVNLILIPLFIDLMVMMEDWRTKSERQAAILNRNFLFMLLNALLLPLTLQSSIMLFLEGIDGITIKEWPEYLAKNLLKTYGFFVTYFIQLMFMSVGFWLLDIPHQIVKFLSMFFHKFEQANKPDKREFVDTYAYDLGYHMSYGLTTFAIALMFSTLVPYVPIFAMGFFMFKYYVDKYNLSFVYNSEFRGTGVIRKKVIPLSIFNIIMVQIVNVGFFALNCGQNFLYFGMAVIGLEIVAIVFYYCHSKRSHFLRHKKKRKEQYHMSVARSTLHQTLKMFDSDDRQPQADNAVVNQSGSLVNLEMQKVSSGQEFQCFAQSQKRDSEQTRTAEADSPLLDNDQRKPSAQSLGKKIAELSGAFQFNGSSSSDYEIPQIHIKNVAALKAAYRHPFEYISPVLYRKTQPGKKQKLTPDNLYCENDEEFASQMGDEIPAAADGQE